MAAKAAADAQAGLPATMEELAERMCSLHVARQEELPNIDLYLDQVLTLVSGELSFIVLPGEQVLTGSMVNNYVKQRLVTPPEHKRYSSSQVATLIFVCAFKRVLSIAQVRQLLTMANEAGIDVAEAYDVLVDAFERALAELFDPSLASSPIEVHLGSGDDLDRMVAAVVWALAAKTYSEQVLALMERSAR